MILFHSYLLMSFTLIGNYETLILLPSILKPINGLIWFMSVRLKLFC